MPELLTLPLSATEVEEGLWMVSGVHTDGVVSSPRHIFVSARSDAAAMVIASQVAPGAWRDSFGWPPRGDFGWTAWFVLCFVLLPILATLWCWLWR